MPTARTADESASPEIVDAELHPDSRLRYIQRRMQEEEGLRLSIDNVAYILKLNGDYEKLHGINQGPDPGGR